MTALEESGTAFASSTRTCSSSMRSMRSMSSGFLSKSWLYRGRSQNAEFAPVPYGPRIHQLCHDFPLCNPFWTQPTGGIRGLEHALTGFQECQEEANRSLRACATLAGTSPSTAPPYLVTCLTRLDERKDHSGCEGKKSVSSPWVRAAFICAIC